MEYLVPLGEYVIPVAAIVLLVGVFYWEDFAIVGVLLARLIKRILA